MPSFKGVFPAMITPTKEDETPNLEAISVLVERFLAAGVHGLFAMGTASESYAFTEAERQEVIAATVAAVAGRVPVLAGAGAITTRQAVSLAHLAEEAGADGLSVLTPYFLTPSQEELYTHFQTVAASTKLPVLLYNNPLRTHVRLEPRTVARLAELDNIVGVKDSSADLVAVMECLAAAPQDFIVLQGNDALIHSSLSLGAKGCISGMSNAIPEIIVEVYEKHRAGDLEGALAAQRQVLKLRAGLLLGTGPDPLKEACRLLGLPVGPTIRPSGPMSADGRERLRQALAELGLEVM